ncbi:hypothetical protein [Nocardioides sp.]|uniref:hypothetical protein n=1 Tax=Nocardioides sp. TaxID=35761 RepID=UPI002726BE5E|nr:hypothetical protein [Nocardioides sp.]MDO9456204.1 hypothetical protein [Nocardioides sp.]
MTSPTSGEAGGEARGLYLQRVDDQADAIEALVARSDGRAGLDGLLGDLPRRLTRSWAPGRAVHEAWRLDLRDQLDLRWWPQGVTTAADAGRDDTHGRRLVVMSSYAKKLPWDDTKHGSRVTVMDLDSLAYRHVLLVRPTADGGLEPLHVHAGGVVWHGEHLHVAATGKGMYTFRIDDLLRVRGRDAAYGYRYVLPARWHYQARKDEGLEGFRYSFLSLDRGCEPPALLAGEYTNDPTRTRRLARFAIDPTTGLLETGDDDRAVLQTLGDGPRRMQGAVHAHGRLYLTVSQGRRERGSVYAGTPDDFTHHPHATPMGNEDIAYWPDEDLLYSVSEHPMVRWLFTMKRSWFD